MTNEPKNLQNKSRDITDYNLTKKWLIAKDKKSQFILAKGMHIHKSNDDNFHMTSCVMT